MRHLEDIYKTNDLHYHLWSVDNNWVIQAWSPIAKMYLPYERKEYTGPNAETLARAAFQRIIES
jgi:hypothetical protein